MKIGIYSDLIYGKCGGTERYIEKIIKLLIDNDQEVFIFTNNNFYNNYIKKLYHTTKTKVFTDLSNLGEILKKSEIDVIHFPFQIINAVDLSIYKVPIITTMHDIQYIHYPEFLKKSEIKWRESQYRKSILLSDQVIVSYKHIKDDLINHFNVEENKISICKINVDNNGFNEVKEDTSILDKYNLRCDYIFYPAQMWEHKNHIGLLYAIKLLFEQYSLRIKVVFTGNKENYYKEIIKKVIELRLEDYVKFVGFVTDQEIKSLYLNAKLVVIPTFYEAGSFPLMEAMNLKVPVICSNVTSLPDTIGDVNYIFDPNNVNQMMKLIYKMFKDKEFIRLNIKNSNKQIEKIKNENYIEYYLNAYKLAIDNYNNENNKNEKEKYLREKYKKIWSINKKINNISDKERIGIYGYGVHTKQLLKETGLSKKNLYAIYDIKFKENTGVFHRCDELYYEKNEIGTIVISSFEYEEEIKNFLINDVNFKGKIITLYDNKDDGPFYLL